MGEKGCLCKLHIDNNDRLMVFGKGKLGGFIETPMGLLPISDVIAEKIYSLRQMEEMISEKGMVKKTKKREV